jgi:hypothetical protein
LGGVLMHIITADGTRYTVQHFNQAQGKAWATLMMDGIVYPDKQSWVSCTVVLGERVFNNVRVIVQDVSIYDPMQEGLAPDTTYKVALLFPEKE